MNSLVGKSLKTTLTVTSKDTAKNIGSGGFEVLATPSLVIWTENYAYNWLEEQLEEGQSSVGVYFQIDHLAPTAVGDEVELEIEVTGQHKKTVSFGFRVNSGDKEVARGEHKRVVVEADTFLARLNKNG